MATGSYVYRDSGYGQRLILNLSRSGNTVSWTLQLQSTGAMYARVGLSGWISGQRDIAQGSAFTVTLDSGSYTNANAITATVSAKMFWGGTCTVTASLPAATPAPPAPSGITLASSGSTASYSWSATANTNTYYLQLNTNDGDYFAAANGRLCRRCRYAVESWGVRPSTFSSRSSGVNPQDSLAVQAHP